MKKVLKYIISIAGLMSVVLFCVSATASIATAPASASQAFSEPINMLLAGFGLIGFGSLIKKRTLR